MNHVTLHQAVEDHDATVQTGDRPLRSGQRGQHAAGLQCQEALEALFTAWKAECRELGDDVADLSNWVNDAQRPGTLELADVGDRLQQLSYRLQDHFGVEHHVGNLLARARGTSTLEIDAYCDRADRERAALSARLSRLIEQLKSGGTAVWCQVARDLSLFVDALEHHEEQALENISWLTPSENLVAGGN